ncbi:DUF4365 domain-containing protein [Oerskovia turbata]
MLDVEERELRAGRTSAAGAAGQRHVQATFEDFGWAVAPHPQEHDLGTDLWVCIQDQRRYDLGRMLGVQVKNGVSTFKSLGDVDGRRGWWFRDSREHFEYWVRHAVPHVVVLRNPEIGRAYWAHVNEPSIKWARKGAKIFVPEDQVLDTSAIRPLTEVAASVRPGPRWAGSAWTGAPDLSPSDRLRHALLAPRLVAPHPNAGSRTLGAHEAIALLTAGRYSELGRYGLDTQDESMAGWEWDFYRAVLAFAETGTTDPLKASAVSATEPYERAAATATLAAGLVEAGAHEEALEALDAVLGADDSEPIDHAWLQVHRARSLAETGDPTGAIDVAVAAQELPTLYPDDVTASAIAGSGAALVFGASDLSGGDIAATISSGDTEASWWRAQATSWGLDAFFDESFRRWSWYESRSNHYAGTNRLRGVALVAGFTALHDAWRYATSLFAKARLMSEHADDDMASESLTQLRRAGSVEAIRAGVNHLLEAGPARAVQIAAEQIDLDQVTHTETSASIELLVRGADVLSTSTADAAARWAMQDEAALRVWIERVRPTFAVEFKRIELLTALVPAVSDTVATAIRQQVTRVPPLADQATAHSWARLISAIPESDWAADELAMLLARSGDHDTIQNALLPLRTRHDAGDRAANDDRLRAGDLTALVGVGQIANVPLDAAAPLVAAASTAIRARLAQSRGGLYIRGNMDLGRILVLLNTHFPDSADWDPILELLAAPHASRDLLKWTLRTIPPFAEKIVDPARTRLADALLDLIARPPGPRLPIVGGDPQAAASSALDALQPGAITPERWIQTRDTRERCELISALARRLDPRDTDLLVILAGDRDARIRAEVAVALSYRLDKGISTDTALETLSHLVKDDGTLVARQVASSWPDEPSSRLRPLAASLSSHLSATVRTAAAEMLNNREPDEASENL